MGSVCCLSGDDCIIYQIVLFVDIKDMVDILGSPYQVMRIAPNAFSIVMYEVGCGTLLALPILK